MGYYTRRWLISIWCIICIGVMVVISLFFGFTAMGVITGGIIALFLFFSAEIINLVRNIRRKATEEKTPYVICPRCLIKVEKEIGICPKCGNRL
jgi:uncharacterized paraquat-inducible protein A